ncbi:MAG TPA: tetratricopeptide repeat protein [Phaeodactylibacter sp.]|nr:tetratricopeptide repeat protein [Phaeodactylibacter sp.]
MKRNLLLSIVLLTIFLWASCSPKVQEPTVVTPPKKEVVKELDPNGCIQFNDLNASDADRVTDNYNIYRDDIKAKKYKEAYPRWKDVYEHAPATNGRIDYVFRDGIKIYTYFHGETTDTILQKKYVDTMMMIYKKAITCFPNKKSYYLSKQGVSLFYKHKSRATDEEIYEMLKTAAAIDKNNSRVSTIIPLASLTYRLYSAGKITVEDARKTMENINKIVAHNVKNAKSEKEANAWTQVEQYTVELSNRYENKKGFYDCDYFLEKYYSDFEGQQGNCDLIEELYRKLKKAGCGKENPKMAKLVEVYKRDCVKPTGSPLLKQAGDALENGRYQKAISLYEQYVNESTDSNMKAKILLRIAKIHYAHTHKFSKARTYARKAMQQKSGWGAPLILIGKLYASSGSLCGPGTGWDSQIVTWPAIDKWNEAKRKDPSVAIEANKLIRQYQKFMPSKGDIFQRGLKEGQTFKVKCWIKETTKVRAAKTAF